MDPAAVQRELDLRGCLAALQHGAGDGADALALVVGGRTVPVATCLLEPALVLVAEVDESPSRAAVWAKAGALVMHATQARAIVNAMPRWPRKTIARNWAAGERGGM